MPGRFLFARYDQTTRSFRLSMILSENRFPPRIKSGAGFSGSCSSPAARPAPTGFPSAVSAEQAPRSARPVLVQRLPPASSLPPARSPVPPARRPERCLPSFRLTRFAAAAVARASARVGPALWRSCCPARSPTGGLGPHQPRASAAAWHARCAEAEATAPSARAAVLCPATVAAPRLVAGQAWAPGHAAAAPAHGRNAGRGPAMRS